MAVSPWAVVRNSTQLDAPPPDPGPWAPVSDMPPALPPVAPQRVTEDPIAQQIDQDQQKLQKVRWAEAHPWGTPENHPGKLGKLAHVFSQIGNIAGNIVAPATMANIEGTQLNMREKEGGLANRLNKELEDKSLQEQQAATAGHLNAETPEVAPNAASTRALQAASTGNLESETKMREHPLPEYEQVPGMLTPSGQPVEMEKHSGAYKPGDVEGLHYGRTVDKLQHVGGTLNGKPAYANFDPLRGIYTDPDTGQQVTGFRPNPQAFQVPPFVVDPETNSVVRPQVGKPLPEGYRTLTQGGSQNIPTTTMRNMGEMAETVLPMAENVKAEVKQLASSLGPAAGRWNELLVNKGGKDFPEFAGLNTDLDLLASAVVRTHFGARGGQQYREELKKMFGEAQSPEDLISRIDHADSWLRGYAKAGGKDVPAAPSGNQPQRPANVPDGYHFDANGPKGAGWYAPAKAAK